MVAFIEKGKRQYSIMRNKKTGEIKAVNPDHRIGRLRIGALAAKGWTEEGRIVTALSIPQIKRGMKA